MNHTKAAFFSLPAVLLLFSGCGYSLGYRTPPQVSTISIPIFQNATFPLRREIEFELTSLVRQEFQRRTPLKIVSGADADVILRGKIVDFRESLVVEGRNDSVVESNIEAVVEVALEDYRNHRKLERRVLTSEPFSLSAGESFDDGRRRALDNLAERVVAAVEFWDDYDDEQ